MHIKIIIYRLTIIIFSVISLKALSLPGADFEGVCFYEHPQLLGQEWCYGVGEHANLDNAENDKFSSFKTYGSAYATIYEHSNFLGQNTDVMMNSYEMDFLEDKVSSVKIKLRKRKDFACTFEHPAYRGTGSCAESGSGVPYMPFYNKASSVLIAGNARLTGFAYDNYNTSHRYVALHRSYGALGEIDWDDDFDSFYVTDWDKSSDTWDNRRRPTLEAQEQISTESSFYKTTWMGTHNSYNDGAYIRTFSGHNQENTLAEQFDMGVRMIELDFHGNGTVIYHTPDAGVSGARRSVTAYMLEIDNWLKGSDTDDVIFIKIEDLMDGGSQAEEWAAWDIQKSLGSLIYRRPNGNNACTGIPSHLSVKDIAKTGARVVFYSWGCGGENSNYTNMVWARGGNEDGHDSNWNYSCGNMPNEWGIASNINLINEERRDSAYVFGFSKELPDDQLRSALECGKNVLMSDKITWDKSTLWWQFSWAWPSGVNGVSGECGVYQRDNKSIQSDHCGSTHAFICRKPDDSLFVSSGTGNWNQGQSVCQNEILGASFSTVTNAREGKLVRDQQYIAGKVVTWMNAVKIGSDWLPYPEKQFFSLVDKSSGKCLDVPGDDNQLYNGQRVQIWDCQSYAKDQKWYYDRSTGKLHNKLNPDFCLDNRGQTWDRGKIGIYRCIDHINLRFDMLSKGVIRTRGNSDLAISADNNWNGSDVSSSLFSGANSQRWSVVYP